MNAGGGDIEAAIAWVEEHIDYSGWAGRSGRTGNIELSLERMRRLAARLGDPQASLPIVHVSGTNGKGSTSRMITRLLMAEGLRVGTYSSPHLARYNERFRLDDVDIDDSSLAAMISTVSAAESALCERLMPFEILTGVAYRWFAECAVDVAVVEVGVLGRFDATNVADGRVAVITNIGFDHTSGEGDWRQRIAWEKAGIVKTGAHLVLGPIQPRLEPTFRAQGPRAVWRLGHEISLVDDEAVPAGRRLSIETPLQTMSGLVLALHGAHQSTNCALAIAGASAFLGRSLSPGSAARALAAVRMPGRLEAVATGPGGLGPTVILDGAHNPDAADALATTLRADVARNGRRTLIIGLLAGRDPTTMLDALDARSYDRIIACTPPTARARSAGDLVEAAAAMDCSASAIDDVDDALDAVVGGAATGDQIVVTGSIYLVADARAWLARSAHQPHPQCEQRDDNGTDGDPLLHPPEVRGSATP